MTRPARRPFPAALALACLAGVLAAAVAGRAAAATPTPDEVDAALRKAKAHLYARMKPDVFWEEVPKLNEKGGNAEVRGKQWGGLTAMSVYALLAAGENHQDPKLKPAVDWIKRQRLIGYYALGMRAQIWPFLPPGPEVRQLAAKDRVYFEKGLHSNPNPRAGKPDRLGFYPYWFNDDPRRLAPGDNWWWDLSVSQYGVLGMWACEQVEGVEVPISYWAEVDKAWKNAQFKDGEDAGGWAYRRGGDGEDQTKVKATMTAAGVATLFVTQDYLLPHTTSFDKCKGGANNPHIDAGLAWMDKHVEELLKGDYYGMYGVERIAVASGKKYFGTVDWYDVGAEYLVRNQERNGAWGGSVQNTCFAMLFLARGRAPIVMNKLEYALNDPAHKAVKLPWAQRPRDASNFAKYAGRQVEQFFGWQVVNLKVAPDDLHDAPILYVSGSLPLDFTDAEVAKLREFCDAGGMILFNADCGEPGFTQSVVGPQGLGRKIYPRLEFRDLPQAHPIYVDEVYLARNWKAKPKVMGMTNGVRELMLVVPEADLGRAWQTKAEKTKEEAYQLGLNIFYYAAEKGNLRFRGETHIVKPDPKIEPAVKVKVARLMVGDNPDPEPYGWRRLSAVLLNTAKVGVTVEPVKLGENKLVPGFAGYQVAHLTGTTRFKLTLAQQRELKAFVAAGCTLVVDAAGGSAGFAESAERELAAIFGGDPAAVGPVIPPDELLYTWPGHRIAKVEYRKYAKAKLTGKFNAPRVRGIDQGGRTRVFYSREDLSAGLLGQPCDGIIGYDPASATAIMRNVVLYAAYNGRPPRPPTTAPATKPADKPTAAAK